LLVYAAKGQPQGAGDAGNGGKKPTKQGRAASATKAETKLEVDQALSPAPATAAGPGTIVAAGKDAHTEYNRRLMRQKTGGACL